MDEYLLKVGLAGRCNRNTRGKKLPEIANANTEFAIVFFNSAFCLHMTYFLTFIRAVQWVRVYLLSL